MMHKACAHCPLVFIGARSSQLWADHTWTHPEYVAAAGLDPAIWCP